VEVTSFVCADAESFAQTKNMIEKNGQKKLNTAALLKKVNGKNGNKVTIETRVYAKGENAQIDSYEWKKYNVYASDNKTIVQISDIVAPTPKSFKDCRGLVVSDYQSELEKIWIAELRSKYDVKVNRDVIKHLE